MKQKRLKQIIAYLHCSLALALLCHTKTQAQFSVGVQAGYANNYLLTNASNLISTEYKPLAGFSAAVPLEYAVTDWFAIKAAPGFTQKSYRMQRTGFYYGVYQDNTNGYIQLPLTAQFSFGGEKLRGFVEGGGYAGYWMTAHVKGRMPNILNQPAYTSNTSNAQPNNVFDEYTAYEYNEKYTFDKTKDNRIELGVLAGAGLSYQLTDAYKVFAEATYFNGLTDQQKKYQTNQVPRYNQTWVFSLGIMFSLGKSSSY